MWIELFLVLIGVIYAYNKWAFSYWRRKGVFQLEPTFLFGNTKDIFFRKTLMQTCVGDIYKKHKHRKLVGLYGFYKPLLLVTDPELARQVMIKDFNSFIGGGAEISEKVDPTFSLNPFATQDPERWKERRGLHVGVQTPTKLKTIPNITAKIGKHMVNYINKHNSSPMQVKDIADRFTMDSVCSFSFGSEPTAFTDAENPFKKYATDKLFSPDISDAFTSSIIYPFIANWFYYRIVSKESENFFISMSKNMLEQAKNTPNSRQTFFYHLAKANEKLIEGGKKGFSDLELAGHNMTVYMDSFSTTGAQFAFLMHDLSNNPEEQSKIRKEILSVGTKIEEFDYEKILSIQTLDAALKESLRIHTPVPVTGRTCTKDTDLDGIKIDKGTRVLIPLNSFHADEEYFPDPDKCNLDRFMSDSIVKGTFMPFGDGPKMCLGFKYAQLVIKIGTIYLLLNYRIVRSGIRQEEQKNKLSNLNFPDDTLTVTFQPIVSS